jgi:hypothetical protein
MRPSVPLQTLKSGQITANVPAGAPLQAGSWPILSPKSVSTPSVQRTCAGKIFAASGLSGAGCGDRLFGGTNFVVAVCVLDVSPAFVAKLPMHGRMCLRFTLGWSCTASHFCAHRMSAAKSATSVNFATSSLKLPLLQRTLSREISAAAESQELP